MTMMVVVMMMNDDDVITQISTSVQQTTEVVALEPAAETPWAVSCVPVYLDTSATDSPVQVT